MDETTNYGMPKPAQHESGPTFATTFNTKQDAADAAIAAAIGGVVANETDPIVGAISGIVKADGGGNISAAVADTDYVPPTRTLTATAGGVAQYDCCYILAAGTVGKAKADAAATMWPIGIATAAIVAGNAGLIQTSGLITNGGWAWTPGLPVYVSAATAGALTQTAPSTAGQQVQSVGIAKSATSIEINVGPLVEVGYSSKLSLDPTLADHAFNGIFFAATAGENVVLGDVCYMKSDGKYWKADAGATSTMPGVVMATASISADAAGDFLQKGFVRNDDGWGGALTVGGLLYVSSTAGGPTQTAPATAGDQVQVVGYAYAARVVFFDPCLVMVEVPA